MVFALVGFYATLRFMTIQERLEQCEQTFNIKNQERDQALGVAEECLVEMTKLQGEFRVLNAQLEDEKPQVKVKDEGKKNG